jgi:hypothetical protein
MPTRWPSAASLALLVAHLTEDDLDLGRVDPLDLGERASDVGIDALPKGTAGDREEDVHADGFARDLDPLQHADVLDGLADLGVEDLAKGASHLFFGDHLGSSRRIILIATVLIWRTAHSIIRPAGRS